MIKRPEKLNIANLPTPIQHLEKFSKRLGGPEIYVKRDDFTGLEVSGNKVRKLEYVVKDALNQGCDTLISCGGIQSNHTRATAAVAAKLGLKCCLLLQEPDERTAADGTPLMEGNYFLEKLMGADVRLVSEEGYAKRRGEIMESLAKEYEAKGQKAYIIPMGASFGMGNFGYFGCMEEILEQEKQLGIVFDGIVLATGSGSTYGGLFLAKKLYDLDKRILGVNVSGNAAHFQRVISQILEESRPYLDVDFSFIPEEIEIVDGYVGRGYALSRPEELEFIGELAREEGLILDPVYTGKAMYGFYSEIQKGAFEDLKNVLFIHTGGLYGLFPKSELFELEPALRVEE